MHRQLTALGQVGRRGSALMITLILSLAMASVVMYAVSDTSNAVKSSQREDNYARALAAAEYGAELAVAEIGKGLKLSGNKDTSLVLGDFVVGENHGAETLYRTDSKQAVEQRRIQGQFDRQEFRVQVRSARQVYNNTGDSLSRELVSRGWLNAPENASVPIGELEAWQFRDIYEVTASAQDARLSDGVRLSAEYQTRPVVQAVVKFSYDSPLDDLLTKVGVVHQEDAARLQVTGGYNAQIDWDNLEGAKHLYFGTNEFRKGDWSSAMPDTIPTKNVYNLAVSGEDHNLTKYFSKNVTQSRITVPWKLETPDPQYFGARAGFWNNGNLTLNYRLPDNRESEDNVLNLNNPAKEWVRKNANPYRPASVKVGEADIDRDMWVVDKNNKVIDSYLLGGKSDGGKGLTVTVDESVPGLTTTVPGRINEDKVTMYKSDATKYKSPSKGGAFKIVLGAYEDLRNLYIHYQGDLTKPTSGHDVYVGQYTKDARESIRMVENTLPLYQGTKVRPQTVHTVRNAENQILVRLYERIEEGEKVYYKYPHLDTYELEIKPTLSLAPRSRSMLMPSAEALQELDYLIKKNLRTNITENMLKQTSPILDNAWAQDDEGNWYFGGNYTKYGAFTQRDTVSGTSITLGRISWLRYDPAEKKLYYTPNSSNPNSASTTEKISKSVASYFYEIDFTPTDKLIPGGSKWTGYYVWAYGGYHCFVSGDDFVAMHQGERKRFRWAMDRDGSKIASGFVLYGDTYLNGKTNPDLDMLVKPALEECEDEADFQAKLAEYEAKKALYLQRMEGINAVATGRPFLWQELMGYSVAKRRDSAENTIDLDEPDVIGNNVKAGAFKDDLRTYFRMVNGERVPVGFDELYQSINLKTLEPEPHPLAGKYPDDSLNDPPKKYLQDRHDAIRVFEPANATWEKGKLVDYKQPIDETNTEIKAYRSMDDFLYDVDFGKDANGNSIICKAVNILVGYEDQISTGSDYDYGDLMFTIYIAPNAKGDAVGINIAKSALQWWERDERDGLTGFIAHTPVTVNDQATLTATDSNGNSSIHAANYNRLGWSEDETLKDTENSVLASQFWTMLDPNNGRNTTFPRAIFKDNPNNFPSLDVSSKVAQEWLADWTAKRMPTRPPFYFTDDDILNYVQWMMVDMETLEKHGAGLIHSDTKKPDKDKIKAKIIADHSSLYDLHYIDSRFADPEPKTRTELTDATPSSLCVTKDPVLVRQIAAQMIGSETLSVLGVKTTAYNPESEPPEMTNRAFLPGEPRLVYDVENLTDGNSQYNGGDNTANIPPRQDAMEFPDRNASGDARKATVMSFVAESDDTSAIVKELYADYFAGFKYQPTDPVYHYRSDPVNFQTMDDRKKVWEQFGMKDKRFVIGYHRGGNSDEFTENLKGSTESSYLQDRYEVVSLGKLGWNPFRCTLDGEKFLANNLQNPEAGEGETKRYEYEFKYGATDNAGVPNFVFDRPIDGAGAMVVNGNLIVKDTFAYHGVLVVLGDVIIEPELKKNQFVWSTDGWPLDRHGHAIQPAEAKRELDYKEYESPAFDVEGNWGYYYPIGSNNFTTKVMGDDGKFLMIEGSDPEKPEWVCPLRQDEYRGQLIVQGQLIVKGRIITKEVTDEKTGQVHRGVLNAYWSSDAIKSTAGVWALGENMVQRISWSHNDGINVDPVWQDRLDTPADLSGKGK